MADKMFAGNDGGGNAADSTDDSGSSWPSMFTGAGKMMGMMGQLKANSDQAKAERENAWFLREQAAFQEDATDRELRIHKNKSTQSISNTVGAYAKSGVALSASALEVIAGQRAKAVEESAAIEREGEFRARLARLRAKRHENISDNLTSSETTFMTIGSGFFSMVGGS